MKLGYEINESLYKDVLASVPESFSALQKAIAIYIQLCKKLEYSIEYYSMESALCEIPNIYKEEFKLAKNLVKIDGKTNKSVVCFTFNAIYLYFLNELNLISDFDAKANSPLGKDEKKFNTIHRYLHLSIGRFALKIDATFNILDNNDLVLCKYPGYIIKGIKSCVPEDDKVLAETILNCCKFYEKDALAVNKFWKIGHLSKKYMPMVEKVNLFRKYIQCCPDYSIQSLNYILKCKRAVFLKSEVVNLRNGCYEVSQDTRVHLMFGVNNKTKDVEAFLFVNPTQKILPKDEFENGLFVYEFDIKQKDFSRITFANFKSRTRKCEIVAPGGSSIDCNIVNSLINVRMLSSKKEIDEAVEKK